jgi:site-specific recombinase XerD
MNMELPAASGRIKAGLIFDLLDVSDTTRADYKARIGLFLLFVESNGLHLNTFLEFKRTLAARTDIALATKQKYLITARIFLKELNRQGFLPSDITQNIKVFKQSKKHKRIGLDDAEVGRLAGWIARLEATAESSRLKALVSLLTLQGLRQIEVVRLDVKDVDLARKVAYVRGKGRDDVEAVYLHPDTAEALKQYLRLNHIADGPLFVSRSNNSRNQRVTTKTVRCLVKAVFGELDIDKPIHGFRHYFVTKLITNYGGDLLEVARYTRHRSLETLQVYNDNIKHQADLPRYYRAFEGVL